MRRLFFLQSLVKNSGNTNTPGREMGKVQSPTPRIKGAAKMHFILVLRNQTVARQDTRQRLPHSAGSEAATMWKEQGSMEPR